MNTEMITLVLSLLGEMPPPATPPAPPLPPAVYAEWKSSTTVEYRCPDPAAGIDPTGVRAIITHSQKNDDGGMDAIAVPVVVYPKNQICTQQVFEPHHKIFGNAIAAGEFRLACAEEACLEWHSRQATEQEIIDHALSEKSWKILHYPAGDMYKYPDGVFEIYSQKERGFAHPIGQGNTALSAIADALSGGAQ